VISIRWHARAGQGAKTAAQVLALAELRSGKSVQAFPEYGPERRGAPLRAYTRIDSRPIRRHDTIEEPDVVVVLEPSLLDDPSVVDGLSPVGVLLVNAERPPDALRAANVVAIPAERLASKHGSKFANVVVLGALAAVLHEPPLDDLEQAAVEVLGKRASAADVSAAIREGYTWAS
jgi:pyruvate ferredoxin oxidoreductase gamma subunit